MGEDAAKDIPAYASQLPKQDEEDELQIKHELASTVVAIGEEGLGFVGQRAVDELERIEMLVVRDATKQRFFRIGAGAVFYAAQHYLAEQLEHEQARQLELLQQQYDSLRTDNSDWDMALQDLLGT